MNEPTFHFIDCEVEGSLFTLFTAMVGTLLVGAVQLDHAGKQSAQFCRLYVHEACWPRLSPAIRKATHTHRWGAGFEQAYEAGIAHLAEVTKREENTHFD